MRLLDYPNNQCPGCGAEDSIYVSRVAEDGIVSVLVACEECGTEAEGAHSGIGSDQGLVGALIAALAPTGIQPDPPGTPAQSGGMREEKR
jgi:Zn ribbon nucleic-acid-binding protein